MARTASPKPKVDANKLVRVWTRSRGRGREEKSKERVVEGRRRFIGRSLIGGRSLRRSGEGRGAKDKADLRRARDLRG